MKRGDLKINVSSLNLKYPQKKKKKNTPSRTKNENHFGNPFSFPKHPFPSLTRTESHIRPHPPKVPKGILEAIAAAIAAVQGVSDRSNKTTTKKDRKRKEAPQMGKNKGENHVRSFLTPHFKDNGLSAFKNYSHSRRFFFFPLFCAGEWGSLVSVLVFVQSNPFLTRYLFFFLSLLIVGYSTSPASQPTERRRLKNATLQQNKHNYATKGRGKQLLKTKAT